MNHDRHRILQAAVDAGGSYSISGLSLRDMVLMADVVLTMRTAGLVKSRILFEDKQPKIIPVAVTAAGRRALANRTG